LYLILLLSRRPHGKGGLNDHCYRLLSQSLSLEHDTEEHITNTSNSRPVLGSLCLVSM
jgi:hypothetical protein